MEEKVKEKAKDQKGKRGRIIIPVLIVVLALLVVAVGYPLYLRNKILSGDGKTHNSSSYSYKNPKYSDIYSKLEKYKKYKEEREKIVYDAVESSNDSSTSSSGSTGIIETNVRTTGIDEADVVKTDGKLIFEFANYEANSILCYSVDNGQIAKEGEFEVGQENCYFKGFYLYDDKLVVLGNMVPEGLDKNYAMYNSETKSIVKIYDVSDIKSPELKGIFTQDGAYFTSRMVDGRLYTFSRKSIDINGIKKRKPETYIPEIDGDLIAPDDIYVYDDSNVSSFAVISSIDVDSAEMTDHMAVLGATCSPYVTEENIYIYDLLYENGWGNGTSDTVLMKIKTEGGMLNLAAEGTFPGGLNNDYSIDEYNGYVRLVSTYTVEKVGRFNGLFVFDENLNKVSSVDNLAPDETIRSARFTGDEVYFVTFRTMDPLFVVNLSDPENPEISDYLKMPGFSQYMHPYGDDKMLGIGYDADPNTGETKSIKFSMYDISDIYDIKEECNCVCNYFNEINVLRNRNSFYYNPDDGTFGCEVYAYHYVPIGDDDYEYTGPETEEIPAMGEYYMLFDYEEGEGFKTIIQSEVSGNALVGDCLNQRGIRIGDYFYLVTSFDGITSYDISDYSVVDKCE